MNYVHESVSLIAHLFVILSFWQKKKVNLFIVQVIACGIFVIYFSLAGGLVSALSNVVMIIRYLTLLFYYKKKEETPVYFMLLFMSMSAILGFAFFGTFFDLIPIILTALFTYLCFYGNTMSMRLVGGVIGSLAWVAYYAVNQAWVGVAFNGAIAVCTAASMTYFYFKERREGRKLAVEKLIRKERKRKTVANLIDSGKSG